VTIQSDIAQGTAHICTRRGKHNGTHHNLPTRVSVCISSSICFSFQSLQLSAPILKLIVRLPFRPPPHSPPFSPAYIFAFHLCDHKELCNDQTCTEKRYKVFLRFPHASFVETSQNWTDTVQIIFIYVCVCVCVCISCVCIFQWYGFCQWIKFYENIKWKWNWQEELADRPSSNLGAKWRNWQHCCNILTQHYNRLGAR